MWTCQVQYCHLLRTRMVSSLRLAGYGVRYGAINERNEQHLCCMSGRLCARRHQFGDMCSMICARQPRRVSLTEAVSIHGPSFSWHCADADHSGVCTCLLLSLVPSNMWPRTSLLSHDRNGCSLVGGVPECRRPSLIASRWMSCGSTMALRLPADARRRR